jgi:hypothetical protein
MPVTRITDFWDVYRPLASDIADRRVRTIPRLSPKRVLPQQPTNRADVKSPIPEKTV